MTTGATLREGVHENGLAHAAGRCGEPRCPVVSVARTRARAFSPASGAGPPLPARRDRRLCLPFPDGGTDSCTRRPARKRDLLAAELPRICWCSGAFSSKQRTCQGHLPGGAAGPPHWSPDSAALTHWRRLESGHRVCGPPLLLSARRSVCAVCSACAGDRDDARRRARCPGGALSSCPLQLCKRERAGGGERPESPEGSRSRCLALEAP